MRLNGLSLWWPMEHANVDEFENPGVPPESLRSKLWNQITHGQRILRSKEMSEACAFYDAVRKDIRRSSYDCVVDGCGGHGALGMLMVAHGVAPRAVVIDQHRPPSFEVLRNAWSRWLRGEAGVGDAVLYDERPIQHALQDVLSTSGELGQKVVVIACHACQHLAQIIVDCCLQFRVDFAVCPCCPKDFSGSFQSAAKALEVDFGVAMVIAEMGRIAGSCDVRLRTFDPKVSPHNRIILGRCLASHEARTEARMQAVDKAETRMCKAYARAHRQELLSTQPLSRAAWECWPATEETYQAQLAEKVASVETQLGGLPLNVALLSPPLLEIRRSP